MKQTQKRILLNSKCEMFPFFFLPSSTLSKRYQAHIFVKGRRKKEKEEGKEGGKKGKGREVRKAKFSCYCPF
jgi:hypothetical protein